MICDNSGIRSERISKNKKKRKGNCDPIRKDCFLSARGFDLLNLLDNVILFKNIHLIYIKIGVAYCLCCLTSMSNDINVAGHQNYSCDQHCSLDLKFHHLCYNFYCHNIRGGCCNVIL